MLLISLRFIGPLPVALPRFGFYLLLLHLAREVEKTLFVLFVTCVPSLSVMLRLRVFFVFAFVPCALFLFECLNGCRFCRCTVFFLRERISILL